MFIHYKIACPSVSIYISDINNNNYICDNAAHIYLQIYYFQFSLVMKIRLYLKYKLYMFSICTYQQDKAFTYTKILYFRLEALQIQISELIPCLPLCCRSQQKMFATFMLHCVIIQVKNSESKICECYSCSAVLILQPQ